MYTMSREIGIDAGHRVPTHGSKCKNLHGHRYTIQAICEAGFLQSEGEQKAMVIDFGFLKEEMMDVIDADCDHGLILYSGDPLLERLIDEDHFSEVLKIVKEVGWCTVKSANTGVGKIYLIQDIPTAEVLARHWFYRLKTRVQARSSGDASLVALKVWETPNCWAIYSGDPSHATR